MVQIAPSYIHADDCGIFDPIDLAPLGFPDLHVVMGVAGDNGPPPDDGGAGDGGGNGDGGVPATSPVALLALVGLLLTAAVYFRSRPGSASSNRKWGDGASMVVEKTRMVQILERR